MGEPSGLVCESLARPAGSRSGSKDRHTARRIQTSNKRTDMPTGNYIYDSEGATWRDPQHRLGITEPDDQWGHAGVAAKEPDRQTARRSSRGRGGMEEDYDESESRGGSRRGTQARRSSGGMSARRTSSGSNRSQKKGRRGFAAMSPEQQREIARKGGLTVSRNRRHMADIGRIGGEHSHGGRRARR